MIVRDRIARFIQEQGHRVEIARVGDADELSELVFRTRGQTFSLAISELEPERFSLSTAYEVPDNGARCRLRCATRLKELEGDDPEVRFTLAHDDTIFIITLESRTTGVDALLEGFWEIVGRAAPIRQYRRRAHAGSQREQSRRRQVHPAVHEGQPVGRLR